MISGMIYKVRNYNNWHADKVIFTHGYSRKFTIEYNIKDSKEKFY